MCKFENYLSEYNRICEIAKPYPFVFAALKNGVVKQFDTYEGAKAFSHLVERIQNPEWVKYHNLRNNAHMNAVSCFKRDTYRHYKQHFNTTVLDKIWEKAREIQICKSYDHVAIEFHELMKLVGMAKYEI